MAKFCTKCGTALENEKCPKCDVEQKAEVKEEVKTTKTSTETVDFKESFMDCLNILKKVFIKPAETVKEFVTDNKFATGIIMILITALLAGVCQIASIRSAVGSSSYVEPDYLKEFMTTFAYSAAEYAIMAVVGYIVVTQLFKGKITIKEMFCLIGVAFSAVLVGFAVCSIIVFIDGEVIQYIIKYITLFGAIFGYLLIYEGIKQKGEIDKEKIFLSVAAISIFAVMVVDILHKLFD